MLLLPSSSAHQMMQSRRTLHSHVPKQQVLAAASACGTRRTIRSAAPHQQRARQLQPFAVCTAVLPISSSNISNISTVRQHAQRFSSIRRHALPPLAMVNVDFASPSLVLGVTLIGCGVALLQVRNMQREVSRDADIVVAAMISIVGSTLIFQGWRLDPLLLLCQALTTSVAFWYGLEAFKLRAEVVQDEAQDGDLPGQQMPPLSDQFPGSQQQPDFTSAARSGYLPPGADQPAPWAQQQQQQQQAGGGYGGANSGTRWGLPPAGQQQAMPYDAYAAGGALNGMRDTSYAGYEQEAGSSGQQQYMQGVGDYAAGGSAGYDHGMYGPGAGAAYGQQQQQPGQMQPGQQLYEWPPGAYEQQQQQPPSSYQQPGWYDAAGMPFGAVAPGGQAPQQQQQPQQAPYSSLPGLIDPYMAGAAAAGAAGPLPDGSMLPGPYSNDGGSIGLPAPAEQQPQGQQQQQAGRGQRQGSSRNGYEQVDDWE